MNIYITTTPEDKLFKHSKYTAVKCSQWPGVCRTGTMVEFYPAVGFVHKVKTFSYFKLNVRCLHVKFQFDMKSAWLIIYYLY